MILLDTHVVVWLLLAPEMVSRPASQAILQARLAGETLACSPVSIYEIANAARRGRIDVESTIEEFTQAILAKLELAPLTPEIAACAGGLQEPFHGDPMDRIIAATAISLRSVLVTRDERIRRAGVCRTLW